MSGGYADPMATQKVSVTLDAESIDRARSVVGARGLSAYLDSALREKLEREDRRLALLDLLDEMERDDPTPREERDRGRARAARLIAEVGG